MSVGGVLVAAGTAMGASFGASLLLIRPAERRGWCDRPDVALKPHERPIPFVGGVGVLLGFALGLGLLVWHGSGWRNICPWLAIAALSFVAGSYDDFRWKRASVPGRKFLIQTGVALVAGTALGIGGAQFATHPLISMGLTAGFILGGMNSVNLEDGMDGLAGGEGLISALGLALAGAGPVAVALAGALAGFIVLNRHPARIFLGDGGSHLVGAVVAGLAVATAGRIVPAPEALVVGSLFVGLPVLGAVWVIVRRVARRAPVAAGGRDHLYDILHQRGLPVQWTVAASWATHAALVGIGALWLLRK